MKKIYKLLIYENLKKRNKEINHLMIEQIHILMLKNQIMIMHEDILQMNNDILQKNISNFQLIQLNQIQVYLENKILFF